MSRMVSPTSTIHCEPSTPSPSEKVDFHKPLPIEIEFLDNRYTLRRRPWRLYTTSFDKIISFQYEGSGTDEDPFVVDWLPNDEGDDAKGREIEVDPECPMNWPQWYKWTLTLLVATATLAVAFASSALSAAVPSIMADFPGYANQVYVLITSAFVVGFMFGPLIWGPSSEVFGRRNLFILTYVFFTFFNGTIIASKNIWTVIILRFVAGVWGSSPLTNAGATVSDIFNAVQRGLGLAVFMTMPTQGPALGPIVGGFVGESIGWRWLAGILTIFSALLTLLGTLFIPETYAPLLLRRRAQLLSKVTGHVYRSKFEKAKSLEIIPLYKKALTRPWVMLFTEPIVFLFTLYMAIVYGTLYMCFGAFPIVFTQIRHWSPGKSGLAFLGVECGFILSLIYIIVGDTPGYAKKLRANGGWLAPEARLSLAMIGGILIPISLFGFAWTAAPASIHWSAPSILTAPFGAGMILVFISVTNYLIDAYLVYAASVLAANSVLRSLFGVVFPLFTAPMYHNLGVNWATTLVAFLSLACMPIPFLFYKYGPAIREKCKFAREADVLNKQLMEAAQAKFQKDAAR